MERYLVVTDCGGGGIYYHLISPGLWRKYGEMCQQQKFYGRESVMDGLVESVYASLSEDEREALIETPDPSNEYAFFTEAHRVFSFCAQHDITVIGGIG